MAKFNSAMEDLLRYNAALVSRNRSGFDKRHSHTTTMDSGYLVPLMYDRVVPGDEKKIKYSGLARMSTPLFPVMDEARYDVWCFYVPDRLWWRNAKAFYGENTDAWYNEDGQYKMPSIGPLEYLVNIGDTDEGANLREGLGSLNDYFGMPCSKQPSAFMLINGDDRMRVDVGLWRSYQLIWNYWFRNNSIQPATPVYDDDVVSSEEWETVRQIRKVCKYPDVFTSLLKQPQSGGEVALPLGEWAPVVTKPDKVDDYISMTASPLIMGKASTYGLGDAPNAGAMNVTNTGSVYSTSSAGTSSSSLMPMNLWADLTNATAATINNLRAAITIQHLLETDARAGKMYQSILQAHFGVLTPDATVQKPELLGLCRQTIGMKTVLQSAPAASSDKPGLGSTGAFSSTSLADELICDKAFTEYGYLIVVGAIRPLHSYSQGIDPLLQKLNRYDHYWPVFDNLGNQPVYKRAIYASYSDGDNPINDLFDVFGYQEAWTEYKIKQNRVSGLMRPDVPGTLSAWNYTTHLKSVPTLNSDFVEEDPEIIDRTIAVQSEPQFIVDSYFDYIDNKGMSVHSIPGVGTL